MSLNRRQLIASTLALLPAAGTLLADEERVPAFHRRPPTGVLPDTKDPHQFESRPVVKRVYELAGKIKPVLYQLPCFCSCDQFAGHGSLLDCFADAHGEECGICQREAVFAYQQTMAKVPVNQIRARVIAGAWQKVDMSPAALMAL